MGKCRPGQAVVLGLVEWPNNAFSGVANRTVLLFLGVAPQSNTLAFGRIHCLQCQRRALLANAMPGSDGMVNVVVHGMEARRNWLNMRVLVASRDWFSGGWHPA